MSDIQPADSLRPLRTSPRPPRKDWYPGLDGVRAVAVALVFSVHYMGRQTHGVGWIGVMIFFVLSGFLITGILFDNQHEPHRFRNFYVRRTLRIFPLFYFVWLCILVAGIFVKEYWHPVLLLWPTYLGNYARFIGGMGADRIYTSHARIAIEIGHFWSLAVEEQFYLLWPLVVFLVGRRSTLIRICIAVVVCTPLLRFLLVALLPHSMLDVEFLYRMTFTEADAFLFGGLLALLMRGPAEASLLRAGPKLLYGALGALVVAAIYNQHVHGQSIAATTPWMSTYGFTLLDVAAGGLLICSLQPATHVFRAMTLRPVRLLGKYSYGFYVYHVILGPLLNHVLPALNLTRPKYVLYSQIMLNWAIAFLAVLAVSAASYHLVERPFLKLKDRFTTLHNNPDAQESSEEIATVP